VLAARQGIIADFDKALSEIRQAGLWVSDSIAQVLKSKI